MVTGSIVLITRPEPDATLLAHQCAERNLETIVSPIMEIRAIPDLVLPGDAGAIAFTSANGVRMVPNGIARDLPAFCVGAATAHAAEKAGFEQVFTAKGDVDALAETINAHRDVLVGPVVHIAGTRRAGDLVAALASQNISAIRLVAYETNEASSLPNDIKIALSAGGPLLVPLYSPRTAALFVRLVGDAGLTDALSNCTALCLSEAVARNTNSKEWKSIHVARETNSEAMLALFEQTA